ncbi:hypothetical protein A3844_04295 [Paenibacillus helianthi]|uniref:Uncharacterized protein n=1 Tax=Paenibacillus helianthi TaxID=1349432 RepID=A0ABX3EX73_9BACL|nr:hypothetical protein A3844_04295 [Paenibacillus helianthi]
MWRRIDSFLQSEVYDHFTEDAGLRFLEQEYDYFELEKTGNFHSPFLTALGWLDCLEITVTWLYSAQILQAEEITTKHYFRNNARVILEAW